MSKQKDILGTSGEENLGLVIDFAQKLKSGALTPTKAKRFLRGEITDFPVWKTIKLGIKPGINPLPGRTVYSLLAKSGYKINEFVQKYLWQTCVNKDLEPDFSASENFSELNLVVISPYQLGFKKTIKLEDFFSAVLDLGLKLCPLEVGPQLRLQYDKHSQLVGDYLLIATLPIKDVGDDELYKNHRYFNVGRNEDGLFLGFHFTSAKQDWPVDLKWVFCKKQ